MTNSTAAPSKRRLALLGIGAVVILAGTLLPRMLTLPALEGAAETPKTPLDNLSPETRSLVEHGLIGVSGATLMGIAAAWVMRRRRAEAAVGPRLLNITATLPLPHHCCAFLIETGDRVFLAGTDAGGVRSIIALPTPPAPEEHASPESIVAPRILEVSA